MKNKFKIAAISLLALATVGCTRIETGQAGVRTDFSRNIQKEELLPGSWNQTMFGDVDIFPVKDVQVDVFDMNPLASDNSTIKDFDVSVIYSIEPSAVADIYIDKSRSFHAMDDDGQTYLMFNYIKTITRAATYKVARRYESLKMNDSRAEIEQLIRQEIVVALTQEKLQNALTISQVQVRAITPADAIVESANALVEAQNNTKKKAEELNLAKIESERIATLNQNKGAIEYMNAMALQNISEGIKEGTVSTIVVPYNFQGIVQVQPK